MSWRRESRGTPEAVAAEVATWEQSICDIDDAAGTDEAIRRIHAAQCAGVQAGVSRFTLATPEDHVVHVIASGGVNGDDSTLTLSIATAKRSGAVPKASTHDGRAQY